ncbi:MAG TPA: hypothetical protein VIY47_08170 [Ignavibacteriaceae bacterium]
MKLLFLTLLLSSNGLFAQTSDYKSILELKNSLKLSDENFQNELVNFSYDYNSEKKSVGLGIVYSLLLPGMGELYADAYDIGKYFTIADGILWGTFIGMEVYSNWQENNYQTYAAANADVDNNNKDADYYSTIGNYTSVFSYNEEKALERNFDEMLDPETDFWKWNTTDERQTYRDMWTSSEQTSNDIRFVVGGLILNRVASAVNAARLVTAYNNKLKEALSWNFSVGFINQQSLPTSLTFIFQKSL